METTYIVLGIALILAGPVMLWVAWPNKQGRTRSFLQSDFLQSVYSIAIIAVVVMGVALLASQLGVSAGVVG